MRIGAEKGTTMVDQHTLMLYVPAMLAITLAPGADTLFVVASALRYGPRGGVLATGGIISGGSIHIGFATVGLSALLLRSALAFSMLKYIGAAYLLYIGIKTLRSSTGGVSADEPHEGSAGMIFRRGFVTNVLNPKVALFVVAFFPQFVSPSHGPLWSQMLELGALWYATGLVWLSFVGIAVGYAGHAVEPSQKARAVFKYVTGSIFVALGVRVALPE
jgi:threonine/homoserine/homoserine lactone efflux protein